jgi:acetyltransferase-like isoleucine patch superfamily enzyme
MPSLIKYGCKYALEFLAWIIAPFFVVQFRALLRFFLDTASTNALKLSFKRIGSGSRVSWRSKVLNPQFIEIGERCIFLRDIRMTVIPGYQEYPRIKIGDRVIANTNCHISCINKIEIGEDVLIASHVFITDHSHGTTESDELQIPPNQRELISSGPVEIGPCVWIGEGVTILPGTRIGRNSIVGANAVLKGEFPDNSIIVGTPARVLKRNG